MRQNDGNVHDWHPDLFRVLVTLGESTTAGGWSTTPERCWAARLAARISDFQDEPVQLINSGIGDNVISTRSAGYEGSGKPAASERIGRHVIAHRPDLLIVSYGLNDARGGTPIGVFREELVSLLAGIREGCSPLIVLLGSYFSLRESGEERERLAHATPAVYEAFNAAIEEVARDSGCLFCDVYRVYGGAPWLVHVDRIHANDVGHQIVADTIFRTLATNCSGLAARTWRIEQESPRWRDEAQLRADYGYE